MLHSILVLGADAASSLMQLGAPVRPTGQRPCWRWCIACVAAWLCVFGVAAPVLIYIFKQPVLIVFVQVSMLSEFYVSIAQNFLGVEGSAALPSLQIHNAVRTWTEISNIQNKPASFRETMLQNL